MKHALICNMADPLVPIHLCTRDAGHDGAHADDRYPGWRWPKSRAGLVR